MYEAVDASIEHEAHFTPRRRRVDSHPLTGQYSAEVRKATTPHLSGISRRAFKKIIGICNGCILWKSGRVRRKYKESIGTLKPVDLVYFDMGGPMKIVSFGKAGYSIASTD